MSEDRFGPSGKVQSPPSIGDRRLMDQPIYQEPPIQKHRWKRARQSLKRLRQEAK